MDKYGKKELVYLSGNRKMSRDYFQKAEVVLTRLGYGVINPTDLVLVSSNLEQWQYMLLCEHLIKWADRICMLENWEDCDSAVFEFNWAKEQHIPIIYQNDLKKGERC